MVINNLNILLVEDNPADQVLFKELLSSTDLKIKKLNVCDGLPEVKDHLSDDISDIVMLDLSSKNNDGLKSFKYIKEKFPDMPFIIISEQNDKQIAGESIVEGIQDHIIKGKFDAVILEKSIKYAIQKQWINSRLEMANERLNSFGYSVSHDLRGPVMNLKSLINLFQSVGDEVEQQQLVELLKTSVNRLEYVVDNLNEVLKIQDPPEKVSNVSLHSVLKEVLKKLNHSILDKKVKISIDFKRYPSVRLVKEQLYSLLFNLVSNAIKYAKKGVPPIIKIIAERKGSYFCLSVKDNGTGIDPKLHDKVFRIFYRNNLEEEGKGIGLHLVRTIAQNNGGKVEIESRINAGSVFKVFLKEKRS